MVEVESNGTFKLVLLVLILVIIISILVVLIILAFQVAPIANYIKEISDTLIRANDILDRIDTIGDDIRESSEESGINTGLIWNWIRQNLLTNSDESFLDIGENVSLNRPTRHVSKPSNVQREVRPRPNKRHRPLTRR